MPILIKCDSQRNFIHLSIEEDKLFYLVHSCQDLKIDVDDIWSSTRRISQIKVAILAARTVEIEQIRANGSFEIYSDAKITRVSQQIVTKFRNMANILKLSTGFFR